MLAQRNKYKREPNQFYMLKNGDRVTLARKEVVLVFNHVYEVETGDTVDFTHPCARRTEPAQDLLAINLGRREILMEGKPIYMSGKDIELLLFLYQNRKKAVSYNDIKVKIWPERLTDFGTGIPDVGADEITALVYWLRKRLGKQVQ